MEEQMITVKDLALELGMDRSHCRKFVYALCIEPLRVRPTGTRGSPMLALRSDHAERVRQERTARGFAIGERRDPTEASVVTNDTGAFYIIVLDPEARPDRLKYGYAQNVESRLLEHRTAAPGAKLLRCWPARRNWEPCIIAALSVGATQVGAEVFDVADVDAVLGKASKFMAMLPSVIADC